MVDAAEVLWRDAADDENAARAGAYGWMKAVLRHFVLRWMRLQYLEVNISGRGTTARRDRRARESERFRTRKARRKPRGRSGSFHARARLEFRRLACANGSVALYKLTTTSSVLHPLYTLITMPVSRTLVLNSQTNLKLISPQRQSRSSRPAARPAPAAAPAQTRGAHTAAAPYGAAPPAHHAPPVPPQAHAPPAREPGMLAQMAATAGSVAVGSTIGHGLSSMLFGGSSSAPEPAPQAAPPVNQQSYQQGVSCEVQAKGESS